MRRHEQAQMGRLTVHANSGDLVAAALLSPCCMRFLIAEPTRRFLSSAPTTIAATSSSLVKVINSHEKYPEKEADELNARRRDQLQEYEDELRLRQKEYAKLARSIPTKSDREAAMRTIKREAREKMWEKHLSTVKRRLNPPVAELQAAGLIPHRDEARNARKSQEGIQKLQQVQRPVVLMRRKYLNYLAQYVVPQMVTRENLEAKVQAALDQPVSYNLRAEDVVAGEAEIRERLRAIRIPMKDFDANAESPVDLGNDAELEV